MDNTLNTTIETFSVPLTDQVYDGIEVLLEGELRDFGEVERSLVLRVRSADPGEDMMTVIVPWLAFTNEIDAMRAKIMLDNWDDALAQMTEANRED